mgnify:CR=1 FL=1
MQAKEGAILYKKTNLLGKTPSEIINLGISMSFVPEDRLGMGLVSTMGMTDNMLLKSYKAGKGPFVRRKPAKELAAKLVEKLSIVTPSIETPVRMMSGGNVQKVLQKKKNVAVMYIGEDLDVLLELSDRIMVLCHGKITGILDARTATKEQIGMLMTGDTEDAVEETTKGGQTNE